MIRGDKDEDGGKMEKMKRQARILNWYASIARLSRIPPPSGYIREGLSASREENCRDSTTSKFNQK